MTTTCRNRISLLVLALAAMACSLVVPARVPSAPRLAVSWQAQAEQVADFAALVPLGSQARIAATKVRVERITAGVPWPRGLAWVDDQLVVLARGRHRRAGGVDAGVPDRCGSLLLVDPELSEPVRPGVLAGDAVAGNAKTLVRLDDGVFHLYDRSLTPVQDTRMDRPYCTLIYDPSSRNLFLCGYSGVDLPGAKFRKNAADSIHRFDLRRSRWYPVEMHDADVVPTARLGRVVPNEYYPHHDPDQHKAPHGWLNGPDGGCVAGDYLYCLGKDNHAVAQYDLAAVRVDADAGPPASRLVLGPRVKLRHPRGCDEVELLGPSAAAHHGGYLYLAYRTSSVVVRLPVDDSGQIRQPAEAELIAVFEPWNTTRRRSANLIDMAFNSRGELFVSCAKEGRIWKLGQPDPQRVFFANDQSRRPLSAKPYVDLRHWTGVKTGCGNLLFDPQDRLYVCVGNYDSGDKLAGAVYRITETD